LASGVPAVAVASGGPLDLVDPSRNGWLYPPGDKDALLRGVLDLAGDPAKSRAMGRRARESVEARTWERVGDALIGHYRVALGGSMTPMSAAA
jgi:phosphatidylinositol alpha 1,6-mannosyltransferase